MEQFNQMVKLLKYYY